MENEINSPLDKLISYIERWLATNESNQKAVRPLSQILEMYKWAKDTITLMPSDMRPRFDTMPFQQEVNQTYGWITDNFPQVPPVNVTVFGTTTASSTSIASHLLIEISGTVISEDDRTWLAGRYESFAEMQERQEKLQQTRELLSKLDKRIPQGPNLAEEYDLAIEKAFYYRGSELDKNISAGIAMRNLHEHYKGKVLSLARAHDRENMTFTDIRYSTSPPLST